MLCCLMELPITPLQVVCDEVCPSPLPPPPQLDKAMIAALGFGAFCAYGVISNVNAGILITIAWLTVVKTTGAMPTAAGNWPTFLAVYAGESSHCLLRVHCSW